MPARHTTQQPLAPELDAIATAAADQLRAQTDGNTNEHHRLQRTVAETASAAIAAGVALAAIADAERAGQQRARDELGADVLRQVARAAERRRDAETKYEQEILRAARLGLAHREIATAAAVAHATVRAILARTDPTSGQPLPTGEPASDDSGESDEP
jgi:DNA-binding NarL/FixJ family response regulator